VAKIPSVACGDADFTHAARNAAMEYSRPGRPIYFLESGYRPHSLASPADRVPQGGDPNEAA
jgi:hypothetical protein